MSAHRYALLVATSTYRDQLFRRLMAPVNDVKALGAVFADSELGGFEVTTVLNKDADVIMEQVEGFCQDRTLEDTVVLYFSCHGYTSDTGDLFLIARNTFKNRLLSTGVPDYFLRSVLRKCRASARVLILDCCFGGAFNTALLAKGGAETVNIKATFAEVGSGLVVLTASNARESAFEEVGDGSQRKSVFTRTVVEGITTGEADLDGDGTISAQDVFEFARTRIATNQSRQTPTMTTIGAEGPIVIAKARPRPAATNLALAPGRGADTNRRLDLRPFVLIHDTGADSANAAVAAVTAMETNLAYQGAPASLSARYVYQKAKALAGQKPGEQSGISWEALHRTLTDFGTVPDADWPYRANEWKLPKGKSQAQLDTAAAAYRAQLTPVRSLSALMDELGRGRPVLSTFTVYESTWLTGSAARTGVVEAPAEDDREVGNVIVTIVDVDKSARLLRFAHTWGPSWGDRGFGTMSLDTAQRLLVMDQMWSVELDVGGRASFRWDLQDITPDTGLEARPATLGLERSRVVPAPSAPAAGGLLRTVHDGRQLGASYHRLGKSSVLREEGGKASADPSANQVFEALGTFHTFLQEAFDRDSWDDHGAPYRAIVHYGRDFDNAYWDTDAQVLVLGDGDGHLFTGFYDLDVVARTMADAVVSRATSLVPQGESGALLMSLSLALGSMVKQYAAGQRATEADWLLGAGQFAEGVKARALIDMLHPGTAYDDAGLGKDPMVGHLDQFVTASDGGDASYLNCGIPARAFAVASVAAGGMSWQNVGEAWYRAMTAPELRPASTFATFAGLTIAFAEADAATVIRDAWEQVGVHVPKSRR